MFPYTDPVGRGFEGNQPAQDSYRTIVHGFYRGMASLPDSAFTLLEGFSELSPGPPEESTVTWLAFPKTAQATFDEIDNQRLQFQDEYVEWRTEKSGGNVTRVTFTTEFPEYFEALASAGTDVLNEGIQQVIPGANPTVAELFGSGFDPQSATPEGRASQFRSNLE